MSSKPVIAVDIDDVIADSTSSLIELVNSRTGAKLTKEHYLVPGTYWGYYERVWRDHGLEIDFPALNDEMNVDQSHVPILAGAAVALTELSKKYDLVIITSRDVSWEPATLVWIEKNCPGIFKQVLFADRHREDNKTKGDLCVEVGATWLIDDNVEHCESALDLGVKAVLFGQYGWHQDIPENLDLCQDWPAVLEYFNV